MRTTAKQISPLNSPVLQERPMALPKVEVSPTIPDFYQDFLIDGYVTPI
jgi:hypothetical protein